MLRSFLLILSCFFICSTHAQLRIAVQAGYNAAKWVHTRHPGNWTSETDPISGFNAGAVAMFDLKKRIGLQAALLFNNTGTKWKYQYRFQSSSRKIKLYGLNLPVIAMYKVDVKNMRFGLGGGFYVACNLFGTEKGTTETIIINAPPQSGSINNKVGFGTAAQPFEPTNTNPIHVNRFDAGYIVASSIEFNRLLVLQASYNAGLRKIFPGGHPYSDNFKNQVISLSLAVLLSRAKE